MKLANLIHKNSKAIFVGTFLLLVSTLGYSQTGIGTTTPDADAQLEISATNKGVLITRVELVGTNLSAPLSSHVAGMIVYNTATNGSGSTAVLPGFYYNNGTNWVRTLSDDGGVSGISSGTGAPTATSPASPSAGDIYVDESTGVIYVHNGTTWVSASAQETLTALSVTTNDGPDGTAGTADDFDELTYTDEDGTANVVPLSSVVTAAETLTALSVTTNDGPDGTAGTADDFDELTYTDEDGTANVVPLSSVVTAAETLTALSVTTNDGPDGTAGTADDFDELTYTDEDGTANVVPLSSVVTAAETLTALSVTTNDGPDGTAGTADDFDELTYTDEDGTANVVPLSSVVTAAETLTALSVTTNDGPDGTAGTADDFDELTYTDEDGTANVVPLSSVVTAAETLTALSVTTNDGPDGTAGTADDFDELTYTDEDGTANVVPLSSVVTAAETLTALSVTTNDGPDGTAGTADDFDELTYTDEDGTANVVPLSSVVTAAETLTALSVTTNDGPDGTAGTADDFDELTYTDEDGTANVVPLSSVVEATLPDATATAKGILQLTNDLGGIATSPLVTGLQDTPIATTTPTTGQVLKFDGTNWAPAASASGADNLGNHTATANLVMGTNGISDTNAEVGTAGQVLSSTGTGLDWVSPTSLPLNVKTVSSAYTLLATDDMIEYIGTSGVTFTPPSVAASANIPVGKKFYIVTSNTGQVSFDGTVPEFITIASNVVYARSSALLVHWGNGRYALINGF